MTKSINSKKIIIILMLCISITGLFGLASVAMTSTQPPIMADQSNGSDISSMAAAADGTFAGFKDSFGKDIIFAATFTKPTTYSNNYRLVINAGDITIPTNTKFKSWTVQTASNKVATVTTLDLNVVISHDITFNKAVSVILNIELDDNVSATKIVNSINKRYDGEGSTIGITLEGTNDTNFNYTYLWKKSTVAVDDSLITNNTMAVKNVADSGDYTIDVKVESNVDPDYNVTKRLASIPVSISKKALTLGNFPSISKEYDGTVTLDPATISVESLTLSGVVAEDDVSVAAITNATYTIAKAGDSISMILIGTLRGASAGNYEIKSQDETYKGSITKRKVTVSGISAVNRVYDGSLNVELNSSAAVINRMIESDKNRLSISGNTHGTIATVHADRNKTVATDITLAGDAASNYEIAEQPDYITVDIALRKIEIVGLVIKDREYDGTKTINSIINGGLDPSTIAKVNGILDDVKVKSVVGEVADANVGSGKSITLTVVLDGAASGNYEFTVGNNNYVARISPKKLTLNNLSINDKVYDGKTAMTRNNDGDLVGVLAGESVTHTITGVNSRTPNAGSVNVAVDATLDGTASGNYVFVTQDFSANITPSPQRFAITSNTKEYNGYSQLPEYTVGNGPQGETVDVKFLNATAINVSFNSDGTYKNTTFTVQSTSSNYKLVDADGTAITVVHFTIIPKVVTYEWIGVDKVLHSGNRVKVEINITNLCDVDYDKFGTAEQTPKVFGIVKDGSPSLAGHYTAEVISITSTNYILNKAATHTLPYTVHNRALTNTNVTASRPEVQLTSGLVADDNNGFDPDYNFRIDYRRKLSGDYKSLLAGTQSIMLSYQLSFARRDIAEDMVKESDKVNISGPVTLKIKMMTEWKTAQDFAVFYTDSDNKSHKVSMDKNAEYINITSEKGIVELAVAKFDPNLVPVVGPPQTFWWLLVFSIIIIIALIGGVIWYFTAKKKPHNLYFDSSGGCVCERVTAKCKEPIFMPVPERDTMTFGGWYKSAAYKKMVNYNTMPFWEETLFAKWIDNNGIVQNYVTADGTRVKASSEKVKAVKGAKIAVSLIFNTRGGNAIDTITAETKSALVLPTATKDNDKFVGWYSDLELTQTALFDTMPQQNMELFAKWESDNDTNPKPPIQAKSMYGDYSESSTYGAKQAQTRIKIKEDEITSRPVTNIVGANDKIAKSSTERAADAFISSKFAEAAAPKGISVNFITRGGAELKAITAAVGENISIPQASKEGSTFLGWHNDVNLTKEVHLVKMPNKETTLYAKWAEDATVQEMYDKGIVNDDEINKGKKHFQQEQQRIDDMITKSEVGSVVERSVSTKSNVAISGSSDVKEGKMRSIEFDSRGGEPLSPIEARENETVVLPNAFKPGARFLGWFYDKKCNDMAILTAMPSKNIRLFAKWDR